MIELTFTSDTSHLPDPYVPPERREDDTDYTHQMYSTIHRVAKEYSAAVVTLEGEVLDVHPADFADSLSEETWTDQLLDPVTAVMLVTIADGLKPVNRLKFLSMSLLEMVDLGWRIAKFKK